MDQSGKEKNIQDINIGKNFKLIKRLGAGAFGEIFLGINQKTNMEVALKLEPISSKHLQLFYECKLYQLLLNDTQTADKGIPNIYYCAAEGDYNIMAMDVLGPSLEDLFTYCNRKFSLKTTLMIVDQLIQRVQFIHSKNFLHRDIKPDNFLIGSGNKNFKIYVIDLGLSKRYIQKDGKHIPYKENKNLTGTARYASINTHLGVDQGRRDDLESIGYLLIYFLKGQLPWQNLKANNKKDKYERIMEKKLSTNLETLCKDLPPEMMAYLTYCRNLRFDEKPDYAFLKQMFTDLVKKNNFEMDQVYDWNLSADNRKNESEKNEITMALNQFPPQKLTQKPVKK